MSAVLAVAPETTETAVTKKTRKSKGKPRKLDALVVPEGGFTGIPADWTEAHPFPKRTDFQDECVWLRWQEERYTARAAKFRQEREHLERCGNIEQRKQFSEAQKLKAKLADLLSKMAAQGMDVSLVD